MSVLWRSTTSTTLALRACTSWSRPKSRAIPLRPRCFASAARPRAPCTLCSKSTTWQTRSAPLSCIRVAVCVFSLSLARSLSLALSLSLSQPSGCHSLSLYYSSSVHTGQVERDDGNEERTKMHNIHTHTHIHTHSPHNTETHCVGFTDAATRREPCKLPPRKLTKLSWMP